GSLTWYARSTDGIDDTPHRSWPVPIELVVSLFVCVTYREVCARRSTHRVRVRRSVRPERVPVAATRYRRLQASPHRRSPSGPILCRRGRSTDTALEKSLRAKHQVPDQAKQDEREGTTAQPRGEV